VSEQWGQPPQEQPPAQQPTAPQFPQYGQQQFPAAAPIDAGYGGGYPGGYGMPGQAPYGSPRTSKLAITSLVLGVLSLPLVFIPVLGPVCAAVGLVLGLVGIAGAQRKNLKRGIGIAGIILSVVGLIGGGLLTTAEFHAVNACKALQHGPSQAYNDCIKHNLKL